MKQSKVDSTVSKSRVNYPLLPTVYNEKKYYAWDTLRFSKCINKMKRFIGTAVLKVSGGYYGSPSSSKDVLVVNYTEAMTT